MNQVDVVLIYPQRAPRRGRHWIMPSLGLAYLSSALRSAGYSVRHLDHTFMERHEVLAEVERLKFLICIIQEDAERLLTVDRDCSLACLLQHCRDAREGREVIG